MLGMKETAMFDNNRAPLVIQPSTAERDLSALVARNRAALEERVLEYGALLFRGFDVGSVDDFERFSSAISARKLDYTYRSTPRSAVGKGVFSATEYPADQEIAQHCENAYQRDWPLKLAFCCLVAAQSGGETPIADMRKVTAAIGDELMDRFEARKVRYVRHYRPYVDIPWNVVFQTSDRNELARFCAQNGIEHEWLDADTLRTAQTNQGVARHPMTGERVFFNQAHLFHVSNVGEEVAASLINLFGKDRLPRNAYFGDGGAIPEQDLQRVGRAFADVSVRFRWNSGDVMLLDNMQMSHGRRPFSGERRVVASLLDPYSEYFGAAPTGVKPEHAVDDPARLG